MTNYKIPQNIKSKLTKEVLEYFRDATFVVFELADIKQGRESTDRSNQTYYEFWCYVEGTIGWCNAFENTCNTFGLIEVLDYYNNLDWYDSDKFDYELCEMMIEYGLIELGKIETNSVGEA